MLIIDTKVLADSQHYCLSLSIQELQAEMSYSMGMMFFLQLVYEFQQIIGEHIMSKFADHHL